MTGQALAVMCRRVLVEWERNDRHFDSQYWDPVAWSYWLSGREARGVHWRVRALVANLRTSDYQDARAERYLVYLMVWPDTIGLDVGRARVCVGPDLIQDRPGWDDHMDARDAAESVIVGAPDDGLACWTEGQPVGGQRYPVEMLWDLVVAHYSEQAKQAKRILDQDERMAHALENVGISLFPTDEQEGGFW